MPAKIIVVTGSNRGIGQAIIQLLSKTQHDPPLTIYATSRACTHLNITPSHGNIVQYAKLDITDKHSIRSFLASTLKENQAIDVLINNAGINKNANETPVLATQTIDINYGGTKLLCEIFLSQGGMAKNKGARIVNVSSTASQLSNYSASIQARFRAASSLSGIDDLATSYLSMQIGSAAQEQAGWGSRPKSYQVSKALMNALTVVLAAHNPGVMINCCCPGWVDTDMGRLVGRPGKGVEEGARIPVRLAVGDVGGGGDGDGGLGAGDGSEWVSGKYFANEGVGEKGWGKEREW